MNGVKLHRDVIRHESMAKDKVRYVSRRRFERRYCAF